MLRQLQAVAQHHRATNHIRVSTNVLSGGVHHHVRAQLQRALQQRGGEGVINHQKCPHLVT